jgi:putative addiction module killer protein
VFEVLYDIDPSGQVVLERWMESLKDRGAASRILVRIGRLMEGNFGDHKSLRDGVSELRVNHGPGDRVYYGHSGQALVVLLCGGDKRRQAADIDRAVEYWKEYQRRGDDEN